MATLSTPSEYEAVVYDATATGSRLPLTYLPWQSIKWQRVRNDISQATVVVAQGDGGIECCRQIGGLACWSQVLTIERNGERVWDGPITGWGRPGNTRDLTIRAHDRSAMFWKRLVQTRRTYTTVTPYSIFQQLVSDTFGTYADPYTSTFNTATPPSERVTREYFVERLERLYDIFKELTENTSTGFWTQAVVNCYFDELTIANLLGRAGQGKAPRLNEQTTIGAPGIDVDGLGMATYVYAGAAGQGINGFPLIATNTGNLNIFLNKVFQKSSAEDRVGNSTDLSLVAGRAAAEALAPQMTLEQIRLSPDFGSEFMLPDLSNLLPAAQFDLDFEETCAFQVPLAEYREAAGVPGVAYVNEITAVRMDQLDVSVSKSEGTGITEEVTASCRPIITGSIA